MKIFSLLLICILFLGSCEKLTNRQSGASSGWVPIYSVPSEINDIGIAASKPTLKAGKIYVYNNYILQNEQFEGFHIIDNSNPTNPVKLAFLKVPFSTEISIKNNYLYTNNVSDLVVLNISNIMNPVLVKRVANAFPLVNQQYPPDEFGYFECTDRSKGVIVNWEFKNNINAKCRR